MSNNDRFIEVQDKNGTHHIGTSVEYVTMPDGTFLSDNLGNLNVMQKGSVEARLNGLENNQYAPIANPQFLESLSVITQNNNTAFKVAEVNSEWQTKIEGQLLINGATTFQNKNYSKGITIIPPTLSDAKNILVADNGIQVKVGSDSVLNINSNNLEVLKNVTLNSNNLTTTGNIIANNIIEFKEVSDRRDLFILVRDNNSKIFFLKIPGFIAYQMVNGTTGTSSNEAWGICRIQEGGTILKYLFIWASQCYLIRIKRGDSPGEAWTEGTLYTIIGRNTSGTSRSNIIFSN